MLRLIITIAFILISSALIISQSDVKEINADDLNDIIKKRDNKLLLINVWATWCIPCREEFPDLVKLADKYEKELEIIAISVDYEDEVETKVKPFLAKNNVNFKVYINGFKKDQEIIEFFNNDWNGALPGTFIYDRKGKQIKFIEGKRSFESFSSLLDEIIAKS